LTSPGRGETITATLHDPPPSRGREDAMPVRGLGVGAAVLLVLALVLPQAARAGAWEDIAPALFGDRPIADGHEVLRLTAPYRAMDQRAVPIVVEATFADGRKVKSVTLVVDENPAPVVAVFHFGDDRDRAALGANVRLDHASPVRVIVEASDGALYMAEKFVKASGLGVCAAPPVGDPLLAANTMGEMRLADLTGSDAGAAATRFRRRVELDIRHPQNTGLQMNQVTMLYIPLRFISAVEVRQGDAKIFEMEGGMSLSENPHIEFDYRVNGAGALAVQATDTDKASWRREFPVGSSS
jgi:sulfur-oxidizing protein SoxY